MGFLEYISAVIMPFFHNPIFLYILVLIIVGVDATNTMFQPMDNGAYTLSGQDELSQYCASQREGVLNSWIYSIPFLHDNDACSTIKNEINPQPLGLFGGLLSATFHTVGLPNEVQISSMQLFLVMLFIPIIIWIATHKLAN